MKQHELIKEIHSNVEQIMLVLEDIIHYLLEERKLNET